MPPGLVCFNGSNMTITLDSYFGNQPNPGPAPALQDLDQTDIAVDDGDHVAHAGRLLEDLPAVEAGSSVFPTRQELAESAPVGRAWRRRRSRPRHYIAAHTYSNATSADLWRSLADTSGEPVAAIAADYIEQPGIPLITVTEHCDAGILKLHLAQQRFTSHYPDATPLRWQIPVLFGGATAGRLLLTDAETDIEAGPCAVRIKLNPNGIGYYRVGYDVDTAKTLTAVFVAVVACHQIGIQP